MFPYLGDRLSVGGGCDAAVTSRTRYGWVEFMEWDKLLYRKQYLLTLKVLFARTM